MSCENCEESAYVIDKLAKLLAEIAVIVNGPEPPLTSWSYHDLPEKVRALKQAQQPAAAVPPLDASMPARIWLQIDTDGSESDRSNPFTGDLMDLTWHCEPIGGLEVEYVRADLAQQPAALAVPDDAIEAAYWDFDARRKGYGPHKTTPQSERDAFKWAVRAMLADAARKGGES